MKVSRSTTILFLAAALGLAFTGVAAAGFPSGDPYAGYVSATYSDHAKWLCRGDTDDVCDHGLDATIVKGSGRTRVEPFRAAADPKIDCFYVYPTISTDPTGNSDFIPGDNQELFVVQQQAARLGKVCRVFAPIYRQVTLTALVSILGGNPLPSDSALADADLLDAWKHYIANDNQGRGVVLIGHSQGAGRLVNLIKNEIDPSPVLRDRLVSAILMGTSLQVPVGGDVGGDFANVPLCHSRRDTGCAISFSSFRDTAPPPANSYFGVPRGNGLEAACVNPASLKGGKAYLHPYLPNDGVALPIISVPPPVWVNPPGTANITTDFVTLPRFLEARCASRNGFNYLAITVHGNPADPRTDNIGGDLTPEWGLHLADANMAMGDLVEATSHQAQAWLRRH